MTVLGSLLWSLTDQIFDQEMMKYIYSCVLCCIYLVIRELDEQWRHFFCVLHLRPRILNKTELNSTCQYFILNSSSWCREISLKRDLIPLTASSQMNKCQNIKSSPLSESFENLVTTSRVQFERLILDCQYIYCIVSNVSNVFKF